MVINRNPWLGSVGLLDGFQPGVEGCEPLASGGTWRGLSCLLLGAVVEEICWLVGCELTRRGGRLDHIGPRRRFASDSRWLSDESAKARGSAGSCPPACSLQAWCRSYLILCHSDDDSLSSYPLSTHPGRCQRRGGMPPACKTFYFSVWASNCSMKLTAQAGDDEGSLYNETHSVSCSRSMCGVTYRTVPYPCHIILGAPAGPETQTLLESPW